MRYYNSDVVRKELAGLEPHARRTESLGKGIYSGDFTRKTYDALLEKAETDLKAGLSVVLDASYQSSQERNRVSQLASRLTVQVYFIHCVCPQEEVKKRLARRAQDPAAVSDGHWQIYLAQRQKFEMPVELAPESIVTLSTDAPLDDLLSTLNNKIRMTP